MLTVNLTASTLKAMTEASVSVREISLLAQSGALAFKGHSRWELDVPTEAGKRANFRITRERNTLTVDLVAVL